MDRASPIHRVRAQPCASCAFASTNVVVRRAYNIRAGKSLVRDTLALMANGAETRLLPSSRQMHWQVGDSPGSSINSLRFASFEITVAEVCPNNTYRVDIRQRFPRMDQDVFNAKFLRLNVLNSRVHQGSKKHQLFVGCFRLMNKPSLSQTKVYWKERTVGCLVLVFEIYRSGGREQAEAQPTLDG